MRTMQEFLESMANFAIAKFVWGCIMPESKAQREWRKKNNFSMMVNIPNSTGIPAALADYMEDTGKTKNAIGIEAIREKLIREGYNPEDYKSSGNYPVSGKIIK